jgi:hypothetical protein
MISKQRYGSLTQRNKEPQPFEKAYMIFCVKEKDLFSLISRKRGAVTDRNHLVSGGFTAS